MSLFQSSPRVFDPTPYEPDISNLIFDNPVFGISTLISRNGYLPRNSYPALPRAIVVSIHGACRGNGTEAAKGAYGVLFGHRSQYNQYGLVPAKEHQGSNAAAVYAAIKALEIVEDFVGSDLVDNVILMTHSAYLSRGLTEYASVWEKNGYKDRNGADVENRFLIEKLNHLIKEASVEKRFETLFWPVTEQDNYDAILLANEAYNLHSAEEEVRMWPHLRNDTFSRRVKHWMLIAPSDPEAKRLCLRLGIVMHNPASAFTGLVAPIRRLIITGEDRQSSFDRLFGPSDMGDDDPLYWKIRFQVLGSPWFPPDPQGQFLDEGAPWYRPKQPGRMELLSLEKSSKRISEVLDQHIQEMMDGHPPRVRYKWAHPCPCHEYSSAIFANH